MNFWGSVSYFYKAELAANVFRCEGLPANKVKGKFYTGTDGDDVILGNRKANDIKGMGGSDVICGAGGDDDISGGPGMIGSTEEVATT